MRGYYIQSTRLGVVMDAIKIYQKFVDGESVHKLAVTHCLSMQEIFDMLKEARQQYPEYASDDFARDFVIQIQEEISRLMEYRKLAMEGYEETENHLILMPDGESTQTTDITRKKKNLSAAASFSRELREAYKLLGLVYGTLKEVDNKNDITVLVTRLKEMKSPDEFKRFKSRITGEN